MNMILSGDNKKLELVCPRCKEEKENEDCLFNVCVKVKGIEGSSHQGWVLEHFKYKVCGSCQDEIQLNIGRNKKGSGAEKAAPAPHPGQTQSSQGVNQNDRIRE